MGGGVRIKVDGIEVGSEPRFPLNFSIIVQNKCCFVHQGMYKYTRLTETRCSHERSANQLGGI